MRIVYNSMEGNTLNIVDLMENSPMTSLSHTYQSKLLTKIQSEFNDMEQHMFVTSFYCFLNYHPKNDYVIDLDDVWKWIGFSQKVHAKTLLKKQFVVDVDYKISLSPQREQKNGKSGGRNKETILMNVKTFKSFCMKAGTKRAEQIHDYYIKLEELLQEVCYEETSELKQQLITAEHRLQSSKNDNSKIREKALIEQFPTNTQCIYYGTIDNVSNCNEKLIKFGNSNGLKGRIATHHKTYDNFHLVNVFKVQNKIQTETAMKVHPLLSPRIRTITIRSQNYVELLNIEGMAFGELDTIIKSIIENNEYSYENYVSLMDQNKELKQELAAANETNHSHHCILLNTEIDRNRIEIKTLIKKYNHLATQKHAPLLNMPTDETTATPIPTGSVSHEFKRAKRNKDGKYEFDGIIYDQLVGKRTEVWNGDAYKTSGDLLKTDLTLNRLGNVVSKQKSIYETQYERLVKLGVNKPKPAISDN